MLQLRLIEAHAFWCHLVTMPDIAGVCGLTIWGVVLIKLWTTNELFNQPFNYFE